MTTILPQDPLNPAQAGTSERSGSVGGSRGTQVSGARRQPMDASVVSADGDRFVLSSERVGAPAGTTYSPSTPGGKAQQVAQSNAEASLSASRVAVALNGSPDTDDSEGIADAMKGLVQALRDAEKAHLAQKAHRFEKLASM